MELQIANSTVSETLRCQKRTPKGRCTMLVADSSSSFCPEHSRKPVKPRATADLSALLTEGLTEFKSAVPINDFLSRLLLRQAQGQIPPRRASVMAYTCHLLLRTLPALEHEIDSEPQQIIFDLPRPKRDDPDPARDARENWNAYCTGKQPGVDAPANGSETRG